MSADSASEVSGPVATIVSPSSSLMRVTSLRRSWIRGSLWIASRIFAEKTSRSTAKACPAGTAASSAQRNSAEPARLISCLSSHGAVLGDSDLREFEHTSSPKSPVWCAGVIFTGRISNSSTSTPKRASVSAASHPASPAPITLTVLLASVHSRGFRSQPAHRLAFQSHRQPLAQHLCTQAFVEVDRRLVPVEHLPFHAVAILPLGDTSQLRQERLADAFAAILRLDEEIFQKKARLAAPSRIVEEVERETCCLSLPF